MKVSPPLAQRPKTLPQKRHPKITYKRKNAQLQVPLRLSWPGRLLAESENKKMIVIISCP